MPRIEGTTNAQSKFLRTFRTSPFGPGAQDWPAAAILRRWLRRPTFVAALQSVQNALRYQADFQLLSAAAAAAHMLHTSVTAGDHELQKQQVKAMSDLLKLAHLRERFAPPMPKPQLRDSQVLALLRSVHPDVTVGSALEMLDSWDRQDAAEKSAA